MDVSYRPPSCLTVMQALIDIPIFSPPIAFYQNVSIQVQKWKDTFFSKVESH